MTGTAVGADVTAEQRDYDGQVFPLHIVTVEPPRRFAFRWNPLPDSQFADVTTLVEFTPTEVGARCCWNVDSGRQRSRNRSV